MVHSATLLHGSWCSTVCLAKNRQYLMISDEEDNLYRIGRCAGKHGTRHPAENQAGVEKLAIGIETDSHSNDPELNKGNSNQIIGVGIPSRKPQQPQDKETS